MRLRARIIATIAVATLGGPAFLLCQDTTAAQSSSAAPATLPTAPAPQAMGATRPAPITPRVELFLGYSGVWAVPSNSLGNRIVWLSGGTGSVAFNVNRSLGFVADVAGYPDTRLRETGTGANPAGTVNSSGSVFTYLGGPRISFRKYERVTPFAQALFGDAHASKVTLSGCTGRLCTPLPTEDAFAMALGGGLDVKVSRHIAIRAIQAEYLMTRFADLTVGTSSTGTRQTQNDVRLASGLVFRFGGGPPPPPVSYTCSASPASVYPGDPVTVVGTPAGLNPKKTATYTWAADGGKISGNTASASIDTSHATPGTYTAHGHVSEGSKPNQIADCSASYTVMAFQPPTVSCSANPSTVNPGESSTITAQGASPQNRPLTYSYSASEGSVSSSATTATLSTASANPGTITVTCNVVDDKGQTASSTTTVAVQAPPPPPAPMTQKLCSIDFERDSKRPTRVDNEAKACLDDVALNMQRSSDAKVAMVGNSDAKEKAAYEKASRSTRKPVVEDAAQRAVNARDYLVTEKGIDPSRVVVYTGSGDSRTVDTTLVPTGATLDTTGLTPVDESVKPVARTSPAKKHKTK